MLWFWLAGKATTTSGLSLGRSEVLRSLKHYQRARSQGRQTGDDLEGREGERGSDRRCCFRGRERVIVSPANIGSVLLQRRCWQSSERQGGAQFGFPEHIDLPFGTKLTIETLLSGNDQLHLETNKKYFAIVLEFFCARQTAYISVKACLNVFMRQAKKYRL